MCTICECDERPVFSREKVVVARKPHQCIECKQTIPVGTRYHYFVGKWNEWDDKAKVGAFHTCLACNMDWKTLVDLVSEHEGEEACVCMGFLRDAIAEAVECECLRPDHPLVQKWHPEIAAEYAKEQESEVVAVHRDDPGQQYLPFWIEEGAA
jgi:hypothetical protein